MGIVYVAGIDSKCLPLKNEKGGQQVAAFDVI